MTAGLPAPSGPGCLLDGELASRLMSIASSGAASGRGVRPSRDTGSASRPVSVADPRAAGGRGVTDSVLDAMVSVPGAVSVTKSRAAGGRDGICGSVTESTPRASGPIVSSRAAGGCGDGAIVLTKRVFRVWSFRVPLFIAGDPGEGGGSGSRPAFSLQGLHEPLVRQSPCIGY